MTDPIRRALESVTDAVDVDWTTLEAESPDELTRETIRALKQIATIARAHDARTLSEPRTLPFTWGPLEVRDHLARGAHGDVYRAWDPRLEREVALKLLRPDHGPESEAPFAIAEGRLLARVRHPNVVSVYGADRIDGHAGIWMELVDGGTLRDLVELGGPLPPDEAIRIGVAVCSGLAAVHAAGLMHRDVKAQNVVRDRDGRTILMDLSAGHDEANPDDRLEGTPLYLAPELLEGARATVASDIYAVGVLLFFIVTGRYPLTSSSIDDLRRRHQAGEGDRLRGHRVLPSALSAVIDRALSRNPADRFPSADAMRAALEAALPGPARPFTVRTGAAAVGLVATIALAVVWLVTQRSTDGAAPRSEARSPRPADVAIRKVRVPPYWMGIPSHDGRLFPYADDSGALHVWEVATGRSRRLAPSDSSDGFAVAAAASPHGDRVAYGWRLADGTHELRTLETDATWPRVIMPRQLAYEPVPLDWSRDGRHILAWLRQKNGSSDLILMPAEGGTPRRLYSFTGVTALDASLSPDGRFVVLAARSNAKPSGGLLILDTDGSAPRVLVEPTANERLPRWTADGRHVFFLRDSPIVRGSTDGWLVEVVDGVATNRATAAIGNVGAVFWIGLTAEGALYRMLRTSSADVYTASIDLDGVHPPGPPSRVSPFEIGNHVGPAWSPDGRSLAYFKRRDPPAPGGIPLRTLMIQDVSSGETRALAVPLPFVGGYTPRWSPDSRFVVIWGRDGEANDRFGFFRVDVATGDTSLLVSVGLNTVPHSQYAPDGRRFLYVHPPRGIVARDLLTDHEQLVVPNAGSQLGRFFISPDGSSIAYVGSTGGDARDPDAVARSIDRLEVQPFGGRPRELARVKSPAWLTLHGWTPDGQHLLYARDAGSSPHRIWRIPASGGSPVDTRVAILPEPNPISLSPDGRRVAYTERVVQTELWITPVFFAKPPSRWSPQMVVTQVWLICADFPAAAFR